MDTLTLGISTRSDRELLELAAKAAGRSIWWSGPVAVLHDFDPASDECSSWYPLDNDGDALRLAVKLRLVIQHAPKYVVVLDGERVIAEHQDTRENGGDENAATRRAIVRAAAAIGEKQ